MLDWLKTILGETYSEELDKKISEEIGKNFVARADFNSLNAEKKTLTDTVKERDKQLETLKTATGDVDALKTQIAALQSENAAAATAHAEELKRIRIDNAVDRALSAARAKNGKAVKALLDLDKVELDADGAVKGLADQIKKLAEAPESGFLFESAKPGGFTGTKPADGSGGAPGTPRTAEEIGKMTMEEYRAYRSSVGGFPRN